MMSMEGDMAEPKTPMSPSRALAWLIAGLIAAIFFAGAAAGFLEAKAQDRSGGISPLFGAALVGLAIASITVLLVAPSLPTWRSMSPRRRLYWASMGGSVVLGTVIATLLQIDRGSGSAAASLLSSGPVSPNFALAAGALWVIGIAAACIAYHRAIDDHEERAWLWAGLAGWYAFIVPFPAWWVLHRAALVPPVDVIILFILSMVANAVVWLWLKFR
jgi:F0F1-type ATP synthase membrane subunit c/vacuolar-type H+-ATPase subunit K